MIKAVIFDLDGVLVTTDDLHFRAWKRLADEFEIPFTREDNERLRGVSRMESLEIILEKSDAVFSEDAKFAMAEKKNQYYVDMLQSIDETAILPGAVESLKLLKSKNLALAVGSSSKNAALILDKTNLGGFFDAVASGLDITNSKPDPEVFLVAAEKLSAKAENCLVAEDADAGVLAGHNAGMKTLGLGSASNHPLADWSADNLSDPNLNWEDMLK